MRLLNNFMKLNVLNESSPAFAVFSFLNKAVAKCTNNECPPRAQGVARWEVCELSMGYGGAHEKEGRDHGDG